MAHFFATRRGRAFRDSILIRDLFTCQMCGVLVTKGRSGERSAVVDHLRPVALRPDLERDEDNCRCTCRACHAICDSIEKRAGADEDRIVREKLAYRPVGLDGYPLTQAKSGV